MAALLLLLPATETGLGQEKPAAAATGREQQAQSGEYMGALELGLAGRYDSSRDKREFKVRGQ